MNETLAYRQGEMFWQHKIGKCMLIYGAKIPTAANQNLTLQNMCLNNPLELGLTTDMIL